MKDYYVYILASQRNGTLYVGVTNQLERRLSEHRQGIASEFTKKYNVNQLVYYEVFSEVNLAITREKQLKGWNREWKNKLIETNNPDWKDLSKDWS
jgi:putative endonuclease